MRVTWVRLLLVGWVVLGVVGAQGVGRRWEPPPKREDYEAKVMIFHQPEPRLNLLEPKAPDSDGVVRHSTRNDIVGHIVQGLLRHRMSPREKETYDRKVNAARLEEYHRINAWNEGEKVRAKAAQEELRKAQHQQRLQEQEMKNKEAEMGKWNLGRPREGRKGQKGVELRRGSKEVGGGQREKWEESREFQGKRRKVEVSAAAPLGYGGMRANENWNGGGEGASVRVSIPQEVPRVPLRRGGGRPSGNRGPQERPMSLERQQQSNQFQERRSQTIGNRREESRTSLGSNGAPQMSLVPQELPRVPLRRDGSSAGSLMSPYQQFPISSGLPPQPPFQGSLQEMRRTSADVRRRQGGAPQPQVSISEDSVQKTVRKSSRKKGGRPEVPQKQQAPLPPFLPPMKPGGPQQSASVSRKSSSQQEQPRRQEDRRQGSMLTKQSQSLQAPVGMKKIPDNRQLPSNEQQDRRQLSSTRRKTSDSRRVSSPKVVVGEKALVQPQVNHKVAPDFPDRRRLPLRGPSFSPVDNNRDKNRRQPQQPPRRPG